MTNHHTPPPSIEQWLDDLDAGTRSFWPGPKTWHDARWPDLDVRAMQRYYLGTPVDVPAILEVLYSVDVRLHCEGNMLYGSDEWAIWRTREIHTELRMAGRDLFPDWDAGLERDTRYGPHYQPLNCWHGIDPNVWNPLHAGDAFGCLTACCGAAWSINDGPEYCKCCYASLDIGWDRHDIYELWEAPPLSWFAERMSVIFGRRAA
jgi:hypothetical protein